MYVRNGDSIVFIGDSITDAGRREDPEGLGWGYVRLFRDLLWARHPELSVTITNRGIGGDTVRHLGRRWREDAIDTRPDLLVVSIGVNDVWRQLQNPPNPEAVAPGEFESTYRMLLDEACAWTKCRLALCEPTIIGETRDAPHNLLMPPYLEAVARLAAEYEARVVPMNAAFLRAVEAAPGRSFTSDGVHPLSQGFMVMALALYDVLCRD